MAKKKHRPSSSVKGMTPLQWITMANQLNLAILVRVLYTCYGWREKRIKDFLAMYLSLMEEWRDGRLTIKQAIKDSYELTGFDAEELLNNLAAERR